VRESTVCLTCLALLTERFPVLRAGLVGARDVNIDRITHQHRIIHPTLAAVPPTLCRPTHIPIDDEPARDTKLVNFGLLAGQQRSRKEKNKRVVRSECDGRIPTLPMSRTDKAWPPTTPIPSPLLVAALAVLAPWSVSQRLTFSGSHGVEGVCKVCGSGSLRVWKQKAAREKCGEL